MPDFPANRLKAINKLLIHNTLSPEFHLNRFSDVPPSYPVRTKFVPCSLS